MSSQYINEPVTTGKVVLHTTAGDIEIELWTKECPLACRNFIQLCLEKYYDGTIFHRLVKDYIIQGGDPTGTGQGGESIYGKPFKDEFHQRLRFNRRGLVGMANAGKDDNGSQFFFTVGNDVRELDKKHTLFGKIVGNTRVKEKKEKKREKKPVETKKLNLLSFGDEAEEDEMELDQVNMWYLQRSYKNLVQVLNKKGKSAHDVLSDDAKLSKQVAVTADEMADYEPEEDAERDASTVSSIRAKFAAKRKIDEVDDDGKDEDFEKMIDDERRKQERERMEAMQAELKAMQKEHIKALRGSKPKPEKEEEEQSEAMKFYHGLKLKFKSKSKDIVKTKDPSRENQTMSMLERFQKRLAASSQSAILHDKKIEIKEDEEKPEEKKFGIDLDAEDVAGDDWMLHKFEAEDEDPNVSKAKDANLREESEDWYDIHDPRNKMNQRRRGEL
nr:Peptidyl-prolyl cis-trans isomerase domain containing protein [Haemonchus contortus]